MPTGTPARIRRWQATVIIAMFFVAVAGAAAVGWWYARESPAHQGPIVLISVDGVPATALPAYGAQTTDTPAIDTLAADAVVFDRAYAHSPQMLPAHASILSGQLPLQHGVRDDAGFTLNRNVSTLAEMLRSRGFSTGGVVSSFLLRPESGVAQGFTFFDAELPDRSGDAAPALVRDAAQTIDVAEKWVRSLDDQRFFLFVQVDRRDADAVVTRLSSLLKARRFYDDATIVLIGDRGEAASGLTLDDTALRVPLMVKQPDSQGAGRRVAAPVQQIDLVPTILDLVRAPVPGELRGRSLRAILDDDETSVAEQPLYAESLAARYRFGGHPVYALTTAAHRYVRGVQEELIPLVPPTADTAGGESSATGRLRGALDRLIATGPEHAPAPIPASEEERYASFGYLTTPRLGTAPDLPLNASEQERLTDEHRAAALLIGQKKYSAGVRALQAIVHAHPDLPVVRYQLGVLLVRTGRLDEAIDAFRAARELRPAAPDLALALADALLRAGQVDAAQEQADEAIALLAQAADAKQRAAAFETAARVALARKDAEAAEKHAAAAYAADRTMPLPAFVRGRVLYEQGDYEQAADAFQEAVDASRDGGTPLAELNLYLGESLAHLDRYPEAEAAYREELRSFPRNIQAYTSLAMLYRASNRDAAVEDVLNELVSATPTPESYGVAVRLWTILGERSRAEALRSDARTRFPGDPSLALLGRDARR
jgi:tetratricopeptide (TPR) repeat protein